MWRSDQLSSADNILSENWRIIAEEAGIEIEAPFVIIKNDKPYMYAVMVKHFGERESQNGIVLRAMPEEFTPEQCGDIWDAALENGFYPINIHNEYIGNIEKEFAIKNYLSELKWFGPAEKMPNWYSEPSNEQ
jgi:hypothetical protein